MFNKKYKEKILELERLVDRLREDRDRNYKVYIANDDMWRKQLSDLERKLKNIPLEDLMRESLGLQIDFSTASEKGMPPYFLEGLEEEERKNFIIDMETVYTNERFQKVVCYMINVFGMNAIFKYDDELKRNGQIAVIAFRTFLKQFEAMHREFVGYRKSADDDFDPLNPLPE